MDEAGSLAAGYPNGGNQALASLIGNIAGGIILYFLLRLLVTAIVGSSAKHALAATLNEYPAQIGVCWVLWMILWSNVFDNRPTGLRMGVNYLARIVGTLVAGVATFALYYYVLAPHLLGEPVLPGTKLYGSALGWMDWVILWILFYVVYLDSFGLPKPPEAAADEPGVIDEAVHPRRQAEVVSR